MFTVPTRLGPSAIHGLGVFARENVPAGATVWAETPWSLRRFTPEEVEAAPPHIQDYLRCYAYLYEGQWLLCLDDSRFMNHADDDATVVELPGGPSVAARDIAAGEELTCDYRAFDGHWREKLGG